MYAVPRDITVASVSSVWRYRGCISNAPKAIMWVLCIAVDTSNTSGNNGVARILFLGGGANFP